MTTTHRPQYSPSTQDLLEAFSEEMTHAGGTVVDAHDDGRLLIARAMLPAEAEIRLNDKVNGGVAIRSSLNGVEVHPYTYRQVCSNGAIFVQALQSHRFERISSDFVSPSYEASLVLNGVREAIRACVSPEVFSTAVADTQLMSQTPGEWAIQLLHQLARWPDRLTWLQIHGDILERFYADGDASAFGAMNAVTSLARDTNDPEKRWDLEAMGGALPALIRRHSPRPLDNASAIAAETLATER